MRNRYSKILCLLLLFACCLPQEGNAFWPFKKKKKDSEKYLTIEFIMNDMECAVLFSGKKSQDAYSKLFERYSSFKNRQINEKTTENSNDPYEELKKLKELLEKEVNVEIIEGSSPDYYPYR